MTNEQTREQLDLIAAQHGGVMRPMDVVEAARDPQHPFHLEIFRDSDQDAAYEARVNRARNIIQRVRYVVTTTRERVEAVYYVRDPVAPTEEQGYLSLPRIASDVVVARQSMAREWGKVRSYLERAHAQALALGLTGDAQLSRDMLRLLDDATNVAPAVMPAVNDA